MSEDEITKRRAEDARRAQELRNRRKEAKVRQISFWIREGDEDAAKSAMADLTDKAWLALYENGAIERRDDPARAEAIRAKLGLAPPPAVSPPESKEQ